MTDDILEINGIPIPTRKTRKKFVIGTLVYCAIVIGWLIAYGDPGNSLHVSALAWSWGVGAATIFAYVFGAVVDNFNVMRQGK